MRLRSRPSKFADDAFAQCPVFEVRNTSQQISHTKDLRPSRRVLLGESSLCREARNQLLNAAGDEGPGDIKIVADRGALIPSLLRFGRRQPPTGVAGERHDQAGVGELLGRDQGMAVLTNIDTAALQPGHAISTPLAST